MKNSIIVLLVFVLLAAACFAQTEVNISANVDKLRLTSGEYVTFTITIVSNENISGDKIKLPDLSNFAVLSSASGYNLSMQASKARFSNNITLVLAPKNVGKIIIGAVEVSYEGNTYKSIPIELEVSQGKKPSADKDVPLAPTKPWQKENKPKVTI